MPIISFLILSISIFESAIFLLRCATISESSYGGKGIFYFKEDCLRKGEACYRSSDLARMSATSTGLGAPLLATYLFNKFVIWLITIRRSWPSESYDWSSAFELPFCACKSFKILPYI